MEMHSDRKDLHPDGYCVGILPGRYADGCAQNLKEVGGAYKQRAPLDRRAL